MSLIQPEFHGRSAPIVASTQAPLVPSGRLRRLVNLFPKGQFVRYLCVGGFNTVFGYSTFVITLALLNHLLPQRLLSITVIVASLLSTPLNITVAYFGYKWFVFRTRGNHLIEWLRCFAVYGTGMIPGLLALSALTRFLQTFLAGHHVSLAAYLHHAERLFHISGAPLILIHRMVGGDAIAGNIAGAVITVVSTIYSFVGHKKFSFRPIR